MSQYQSPSEFADDFLRHYGVKGMKWGSRRKSKNSVETSKREDPVKKMSDDQLRRKINRIQMERQYRQLTAPQKSAGQKMVQDILVNTAKQQLGQAAQKYAAKAAQDLIKGKLGG